ncbi:MAG: hypothetical protein JM58_03760 [Peptococcaceae bacterium BICA1-8]|nr:MAG: hypothetical protein JM58_03760 [Peptococcaceae bacterium BICA1-8]
MNSLIFIIIVILYIFFITPIVYDWNMVVQALALLFLVQLLWIGRIFPLGLSSLIVVAIISSHFMSYKEAISFFGNPTVWLLFSTFILSGAFIHSGLASRVSLYMLSLSKGHGSRLVLWSFLLIACLPFLIPTNLGRGSIVSSILDKIVEQLKAVKKAEHYGKVLFIGTSYLTALTGVMTVTGSNAAIYVFGMLINYSGENWTYLKWLTVFSIPILVFVILLWLLMSFIFPFEKLEMEQLQSFINKERKALGSINFTEIKMTIIIVLTVLMWITEPLHHLSIPHITFLGAILTIFPHVGVWSWDEANCHVRWDIFFFFGSTLMLAQVLIQSRLLDWVANEYLQMISHWPDGFIIGFSILAVMLLRSFFVNVLGFMTVIIPLALAIGTKYQGISPEWWVISFFLAGVPGFVFITQSPVHLICYSYQYFEQKDLIKAGLFASLVWFVLLLLCSFFLWPNLL